MRNKTFKKQELAGLSRQLKRGKLTGTTLRYGVVRYGGKPFTRLEYKFVIEWPGIDIPFGEADEEAGAAGS